MCVSLFVRCLWRDVYTKRCELTLDFLLVLCRKRKRRQTTSQVLVVRGFSRVCFLYITGLFCWDSLRTTPLWAPVGGPRPLAAAVALCDAPPHPRPCGHPRRQCGSPTMGHGQCGATPSPHPGAPAPPHSSISPLTIAPNLEANSKGNIPNPIYTEIPNIIRFPCFCLHLSKSVILVGFGAGMGLQTQSTLCDFVYVFRFAVFVVNRSFIYT